MKLIYVLRNLIIYGMEFFSLYIYIYMLLLISTNFIIFLFNKMCMNLYLHWKIVINKLELIDDIKIN